MKPTTRKKRTVQKVNKTGRFASDAQVAADPLGTTTQTVDDKSAEKFLAKLDQDGGAIVRVLDLSAAEVEEAKSEGRVFGAYVFVPIAE